MFDDDDSSSSELTATSHSPLLIGITIDIAIVIAINYAGSAAPNENPSPLVLVTSIKQSNSDQTIDSVHVALPGSCLDTETARLYGSEVTLSLLLSFVLVWCDHSDRHTWMSKYNSRRSSIYYAPVPVH